MTGIVVLLAGLAFQATPAEKPIIDNDHATVWDTTQSLGKLASDTVTISLKDANKGAAVFLKKGATHKSDGRSIVISLKDHAPSPMANPTKYPLAFPRPGSKKLIDNARVIVWDYTWTMGVPTPMHFHDKDVVVTYLEDGDLKSTTPDGKSVVNPYTFAAVRFNLKDRTHTEELIKGKQRAIITEFK